MRILVTGAAGFIGQHLVMFLARRGHDVIAVDARATAGVGQVDVRNAEALAAAVAGRPLDAVLHAAARTDLQGRTVSDYEVNWLGTQNAMRIARQQKSPAHFVLFSSRLIFAVGHTPQHERDFAPTVPYGYSKVIAELLTEEYLGPWTIVRPTSIWGPGFGTPYRDFYDQVFAHRYVHPWRRRILKSFGYVENVAEWCCRLVEASASDVHSRRLWLTDPEPIELSEWSTLVAESLGVSTPRRAPVPLLHAAAACGDLAKQLGRPMPLDSFRLGNLLADVVYDPTDTLTLLGPPIVDPALALQRTAEWYLQRDGRGPR